MQDHRVRQLLDCRVANLGVSGEQVVFLKEALELYTGRDPNTPSDKSALTNF